ncbi:MAG: hypothetical protein ABL901_19485 [Hyphomicrobiaceae bacterium]
MFGSLKWMAATVLAAVVAVLCGGGWAYEAWTASARVTAAVTARDAEWSTKLAAANARAELLAATANIKALQSAQAVRFQLVAARKAASERVAALEQALADNAGEPDPDPVVFPRRIAKELRR